MKTLLLKFIDTQTFGYVEPVRKGTAKGDPIGFSAIKHKSTFLFLTNLKVKEIADAVGLSHALLRVWRTETLYLAAIEKHERTFARLVVKRILEAIAEAKTSGAHDKDPSLLRGNEIMDRLLTEDFADIVLYSDRLMDEIYQQLMTRGISHVTANNIFLPYICLRKALPKPSVRMGRNVVRLTLLDLFEALQRPWTPDREKVQQAKVFFLKEI
jgi:hypothetical protein